VNEKNMIKGVWAFEYSVYFQEGVMTEQRFHEQRKFSNIWLKATIFHSFILPKIIQNLKFDLLKS
jgi:hypothetical protein